MELWFKFQNWKISILELREKKLFLQSVNGRQKAFDLICHPFIGLNRFRFEIYAI